MGSNTFLGEFEHLVLLAVMQLTDDAHAIRVREQIEGRADRRVARGALYGTLTRLQEKGFLDWQVEESTPERGGIPRRRFTVTADGVEALRASQRAIANLSEGLEQALRDQ
ncbi:MAG: PadR family transcriptional regulator [Acidobacteria bacterium]|nr:PadR family transcriptional regulator [Acidobacteriota bacterium]